MGIMLATELNLVGKLIYNYLFKWITTWGSETELLGAFAITVIFFTLFLKIITLPLDIWQKSVTRSNTKKMAIMQPELEKVQRQCGDNKQLYAQKQRDTYKKYGYKTLAACLPSLVTMVIFFVVFSGFNSSVRYHNSVVFDELQVVYDTTYEETYADEILGGKTPTEAMNVAITSAETAVVGSYKPEKFLYITNIFMPDSWKNPIPDVNTYAGTGMGKLGITDVDRVKYEQVMKPIIQEYNLTDTGKSRWNGYLILPVLTLLLGIASSKLLKPPEQPKMPGQSEDQIKAQEKTNKMMTFIMPLMMGVFSLFYSAAFTLYMFVNSFISTAFALIYNIITKKIDEKEKDKIMSITVKK